MMNLIEAQKDMREAYTGGSTGVLVSGCVWLISGAVAIYSTPISALLTFFFGGMLIHPLGLLLDKILNRTGKNKSNNPLGKWALLSTILIFIGLYISYMAYLSEANMFFPIMMIAIGIRYMIFQYIYGVKTFWILGSTLILSGIVSISFFQEFYAGALIGGLIEVVFSYIIFNKTKGIE